MQFNPSGKKYGRTITPQRQQIIQLIEDCPNISLMGLAKATGRTQHEMQKIVRGAIAAGLIKPDIENGGYIIRGEK